jgi:hypothetical protein
MKGGEGGGGERDIEIEKNRKWGGGGGLVGGIWGGAHMDQAWLLQLSLCRNSENGMEEKASNNS